MSDLTKLSVDELLQLVFPVEQLLAEAGGVSDDRVMRGWAEIRRRLD